MVKEKSVCFSGYRLHKFAVTDDLSAIKHALANCIRQCVEQGYDTFLSGMAEGFDMMAAEEVVKLKQEFAIKFLAVMPCYNWREFSAHEQEILSQADEVIAVAESAGTKSYHKRNRYLVDNASLLICYFSGTSGGTKYTVNYAKQNKIGIINIFENLLAK